MVHCPVDLLGDSWWAAVGTLYLKLMLRLENITTSLSGNSKLVTNESLTAQ